MQREFALLCLFGVLLCGRGFPQTTDPQELIKLADSFPTLHTLTDQLGGYYDTLRNGDATLTNKLTATGLEQGWGPGVFRGLFLDNITLKVDLAYSKTLGRIPGDNNVLTPFGLTEIKFTPTYEAKWELPLNKLIPGSRQAKQPKHAVTNAIKIDKSAQMAKLLGPYGEFDQARYKFRKDIPKARGKKVDNKEPPDYCEDFYAMKSKALAVLQAASRTESDEVVQKWASAQCSTVQPDQRDIVFVSQ